MHLHNYAVLISGHLVSITLFRGFLAFPISTDNEKRFFFTTSTTQSKKDVGPRILVSDIFDVDKDGSKTPSSSTSNIKDKMHWNTPATTKAKESEKLSLHTK